MFCQNVKIYILTYFDQNKKELVLWKLFFPVILHFAIFEHNITVSSASLLKTFSQYMTKILEVNPDYPEPKYLHVCVLITEV